MLGKNSQSSTFSLQYGTTYNEKMRVYKQYLAIELKQKKIHVKWDIGDGRREASLFIFILKERNGGKPTMCVCGVVG